MLFSGKSQEEVMKCIEYITEEFGITSERYNDLSMIDLMQRIASLKSDKVRINEFNSREIKRVLNLPELKCPRRTTQID